MLDRTHQHISTDIMQEDAPHTPISPASAALDLSGDTGSATAVPSVLFAGADVTQPGGPGTEGVVTVGGGGGVSLLPDPDVLWSPASAVTTGDRVTPTGDGLGFTADDVFVATRDFTTGDEQPDFSRTLVVLDGTYAAPVVTEWAGDTTYAAGELVHATGFPTRVFMTPSAGTSGSIAPDFASAANPYDSVPDNDITWQFVGDAIYQDVPITWPETTAIALGTTVIPSPPNGHAYLWQGPEGGLSGDSQPEFPTDGSTVADGDGSWQDIGPTASNPELSWGWLGQVDRVSLSQTLPLPGARVVGPYIIEYTDTPDEVTAFDLFMPVPGEVITAYWPDVIDSAPFQDGSNGYLQIGQRLSEVEAWSWNDQLTNAGGIGTPALSDSTYVQGGGNTPPDSGPGYAVAAVKPLSGYPVQVLWVGSDPLVSGHLEVYFAICPVTAP